MKKAVELLEGTKLSIKEMPVPLVMKILFISHVLLKMNMVFSPKHWRNQS